jgi:hypothetical protein
MSVAIGWNAAKGSFDPQCKFHKTGLRAQNVAVLACAEFQEESLSDQTSRAFRLKNLNYDFVVHVWLIRGAHISKANLFFPTWKVIRRVNGLA